MDVVMMADIVCFEYEMPVLHGKVQSVFRMSRYIRGSLESLLLHER